MESAMETNKDAKVVSKKKQNIMYSEVKAISHIGKKKYGTDDFETVDNLKAILISSLYQYPEANLYQSAMHPDGFQFTIPNPDLKSVSIS